MIKRNLESSIKKYMNQYPAIGLVGPRQSGKTTLAKYMFPDHKYLSMENLDIRNMAQDDPRGFLEDNGQYLILDEIQRVPELFSYIQEKIDTYDLPACYVMTGSHQFLLMEKITQSLAGRIITFQLYPFSFNEVYGLELDKNLNAIFTIKPNFVENGEEIDIFKTILTGMYPRIHDKKIEARKWIQNYILTYVERDLRSLVNVENLKFFENFLKICASMSGQLVNYTSISNAIGISQPTVKKWLNLLETSGIIFLLSPHHKNFKKRLVKTPKLYFIDTAILCYLLSIKNTQELQSHPLFGNIFETFVISEFYKRIFHLGEKPPLYFWRDKTGIEVDLLVDFGNKLLPIEIKSSKTYNKSLIKNLNTWLEQAKDIVQQAFLIYRGPSIIGKNKYVTIAPWWTV